MNAHPNTRTCRKFNVSFIALLLATLGLLVGFAPSTSAQVAPASVLSVQFFRTIGGESSLFLVSPDAVLHTPEGDYSGRAGLVQFGDDLESSFSDLAFSTQSAAQAGGLVIVSFTLTGINTGSYHGAEANCAGIAVPGVAVLRMSEERVVTEDWTSGAMSQDLGIPAVREAGLVTEQWISYDSDVIASQISAFNAFDPNLRPGCADHVLPQPLPTSEPMPTCPKVNVCHLPG